ncbi:T-cell surface glycoprotein CD4-like [Anarrhichthys ocellatus]|uniref:T-cell surface glycoprotein CD4-like n=1 Tax=Anarrhichthys ocellatus TaxID=433405 RepID=UPI0012ED8CEA|nr:T-cell surface glycoprotein CD4-like [Anarrhichthys ocellatus]
MKTIVWFVFVLGALSAAGKVILTNLGQKATLECGVNAFNDRLVWHRGDDLIHSIPKNGFPLRGAVDIVGRSTVKRDTKLEISAVKKEDAGKFICTADGSRHEHILLVVSVWATPSGELLLDSVATLHCQVKGLDQDPSVQWKTPDGSPHSGSLKSVTRSDAGTWKCMFSHDGGTYDRSLTIKVQEPATPSSSQSSNDVLKPTCPNCVTHQASITAALLLGLSWWVWVAVGVGCLVVVLLMVFVIVLCKRIKRKKRKFQTMKNGRQPLKPKKYCQCDCPAAAAKPQQGRRREKPSAPPLQPLLML